MSFPGEVTSTNGDQISTDVVEWKLKPGVVSTMNAQARYTDPSARSFTGAAIWLGMRLVPGRGHHRRARLDKPGPLARAGRIPGEPD